MSSPKPSIAATRPVNPPGASPILTVDQLWKGLVMKAREPHRFLAIFESCEVVKEEGTMVRHLADFRRLRHVFEGGSGYIRSILTVLFYFSDHSSCQDQDRADHPGRRSSV